MLLRISGLPVDAYLTAGQRDGSGAWTLGLGDIKGVKLVVPRATAPELALDVAAVETRTGKLAAPIKTLNVALAGVSIEPAFAPPPAQSAAKSSFDTAAGEALPIPERISTGAPKRIATADGDTLLQTGDIAGARRAYELAWTQGDAQAALGLARSYDPLLIGDAPGADRAQAVLWYQRAAERGMPEATKALLRMKLKP
jgi:TPR repeat protein